MLAYAAGVDVAVTIRYVTLHIGEYWRHWLMGH